MLSRSIAHAQTSKRRATATMAIFLLARLPRHVRSYTALMTGLYRRLTQLTSTSIARSSGLPCRLILPRRFDSPDWYCLGVNPA